jgi:RNA polymerase sigma factor (sigma-70 family)
MMARKLKTMPTSPLSVVIQHLLADLRPEGGGLTDGELLARFVRSQDEDALAALVRRHASMVWGVCRRLLHHHDAEDAFQATFLVLVRKAADVPGQAVANWLYGVARQTAVRLRATVAKRRQRETQVVNMPEPTVPELRDADLQRVVDEELSRLPDHYRGVLILCDLEGMTRKEAARQLGIPEGSLASRLARARVMLAKRLTQRGVVFTGSVAAVLSAGSASASAPPALVASTIKAASLLAAGQAAGVVSAKVAALSEGVVNAMFTTKIKSVLAVVLIVGLALAGAGLIYQSQAADQPKDSNKVVQAPKPGEKEAPAPALPDDKTAPKEQKVLTPEEALKLRSKEKVTVQFKVVGVDDGVNQAHFRGYYLGPRLFLNGDKCTAVLAPPVQQTIHRLRIDPVKHFTGKVIRVTGVVVQNAPQGPGCYIVVHDLNQFAVVGE